MPRDCLMTEELPAASTCSPRSDRPFTDHLDLSVVIVNWNTSHVVADCLHSIQEHLGAVSAEIIVIDNASSDDSVEMIKRDFPSVRVIANEDNRGFAAGNNQGMRMATGDFVLLLNPDTIVIDDVIPKALAFARAHPTAGIVGCQVLESDDSIQRTCFRFPSSLGTFLWVSGLSAFLPRSSVAGYAAYGPWDRDTERDVDVVSGMFMLVRSDAIKQVGLMDEDYFVFAEEADWCRRFWDNGWRCVFAPVGRILHVDGGSKSTEQASLRMYVEQQKNLLLFHRKHLREPWPTLSKALFAVFMLLRAVWWGAISMFSKRTTTRNKAIRSAAAAIFHWTGKEPCI